MIVNAATENDQLFMARYVDHDLAVNLDSTDAFEGAEKLLEVWFGPNPSALPREMSAANGLRDIPRQEWEKVLDLVQCKVISLVSTSKMDAYVLSESSLFVFPHKLILKTCGTTTLLLGVDEMLKTVAAFTDYPTSKQPWRVFYSRKSFMFPDRQQHPHQCWGDEVDFLDSRFHGGSAYMVGNINADHWYLYTTATCSNSGQYQYLEQEKLCDETFEVMMTDLSPSHAGQFCSDRLPGSDRVDNSNGDSDSGSTSSLDSSVSSLVGAPVDDDDPGHELGNIVTKYAGIDQIYPTDRQTIDSFLFTPCGYSCNGIVEGGHYFTIHVTPEKHCSYASFETTVPAQKYGLSRLDVLERVVNVFRPGKFSMTLFQSHDSVGPDTQQLHLASGYKRTERILYELDGYDLLFVSFEAVSTDKARTLRGY